MKKIIFPVTVAVLMSFSAPAYAQENKRDEFFRKGQEAYQAGDYKKAIEYYEWVVDLDSNFAPVYNALGLAHNYTDTKLSDLIWFFKVATDIDPQYAEAYLNMCRIYSERQKHQQAEDACLKAVSINPNYLQAKLLLAWIYLYGKSSPHEAVQYFNQVLEKIQNPSIYFGLGLAYAKAGDRARALETITFLRGIDENDLALKIEAALRQSEPYSEPVVPGPLLGMPSSQPGTLVGGSSPTGGEEGKTGQAGPPGQIRIRLKGKLSDIEKPSSPAPVHPGSL